MPRPGFTILELVIAIGLLVLIGGLVAPALSGRIAESRFEAAKRELEAALVMTRVDAQREGRALVLRAAIVEESAALTIEPLEAPAPDDTSMLRTPLEETPRLAVPRMKLAAGLRVTDRRPSAEPATVAETLDEINGGAEARAEPVTIAVFMPDGSAQTPGATYLVQDEGGRPVRALELRVNRWTGTSAFAAIDLSAEAAPAEEVEPAPPEPVPGGTP